MNKLDFDKLLDEMMEAEKGLLNYKRGEYAKGTADVLINFKQNADFLDREPEELCMSYMMKHIQSISRSVMGHTRGSDRLKFEWKTDTGEEGLAQRFADARNYLVLLAALIKESDEKERLKRERAEKEREDAGITEAVTGEGQ